jgi:hypothetical protein
MRSKHLLTHSAVLLVGLIIGYYLLPRGDPLARLRDRAWYGSSAAADNAAERLLTYTDELEAVWTDAFLQMGGRKPISSQHKLRLLAGMRETRAFRLTLPSIALCASNDPDGEVRRRCVALLQEHRDEVWQSTRRILTNLAPAETDGELRRAKRELVTRTPDDLAENPPTNEAPAVE